MRYASDMRPSASESKLHDGTRWSRLLRNRFSRSCKMFLPLLAVVGMTAPWLVIYQDRAAHRASATGTERHAERADMPSARIAGQADGRWMALHESFVQRAAAGGINLLFMGDSLTMQWLQQPAWRDEWEPRGAVNFGIGGDRIQHAHWRLQHGEIEISPAPQACLLPLGTNPSPSPSPDPSPSPSPSPDPSPGPSPDPSPNQACVLQLGTNNIESDSVEEILHAAGSSSRW